LYTPCILDCALHFLIKFSYLSKKKKQWKGQFVLGLKVVVYWSIEEI